MRSKPFVSANFDNYSLSGVGDFDNFSKKMSKSPPYARNPPPSGLKLIGALHIVTPGPAVITLFSFIFAALKFRENFLGTFRESLISRSQRKIVFTGN